MDFSRVDNSGNAFVHSGVSGTSRSGSGNPCRLRNSRGISEGRGSKTFLSGQSSNKGIAGSKHSRSVKKPGCDTRQGCRSLAESTENATKCRFDVAQINTVKKLWEAVEAGFDINQADDGGQTALHYAVYSGKLTVVRLLLNLKAKINRFNNKGMTAGHLAAYNGNNEMLKVLLKFGADINLGTIGSNNSLLHLAVQIPSNVNINDAQQDSVNCIETLIKHKANIHRLNASRQTVLHMAVWARNFMAAEKLLQVNSDIVNALSKDGLAALHIAARFKDSEILALLIANNANLDALDASQQGSALHHAAKHNALDCINFLIARGANPFCLNKDGQEPGGVAAQYNNTEARHCLLEHKKNKQRQNTTQSASLPTISVNLPGVDCTEDNYGEGQLEMVKVENISVFDLPELPDVQNLHGSKELDKLKLEDAIQYRLKGFRSTGPFSWLDEVKENAKTKNENK